MSFGIIIRNKKSGRISQENKQEWRNEKRAKELCSGRHDGIKYTPGNVEAMTGISAAKVEKMLRHGVSDKEMPKDGKL